jgi:hypothetical protein
VRVIKKTGNRSNIARDERGSALLSVFLVITMLLILGTGILTLSVANISQARTGDTYERDYYVADGGAKQGVETLKGAALEQYRKIAADLQNNIQSTNNASSFFAALDAVSCTPPQPDSSAGGPTSLAVSISHATVDADTHRYTVRSTATDGKTARSLSGSIDINFVPVTATAGFSPLPACAILSGGTLRQNSGWTAVTGSVKCGAFSSYNPGQFCLNGVTNPSPSLFVDPNTASLFSWDMEYPGFTNAVRTPSGQLTLPPVANGANITNAAFKDPPYNWTVPSPIYLEGQTGASFTISNFQYKGGQAYSTGSLGFSNDVIGTAGSFVMLYCKGNLSLSNGAIRYVKIYCDGNLTINGGGGLDNVIIYCNGSISDSCTNRTNVRMYCSSYTMNGGNFIGDNIVYAENSIHVESTVSGLFYSNGNIDVGSGAGLTGQMAAKNNITLNGSFNFKYDSAMLQRLNADPFPSSTGSGSAAYVQPADSQIFSGGSSFSES